MRTNSRTLLTAICFLIASIVCVAMLLPIAGCGTKTKSPSIVGTWTGHSADGQNFTFIFKKDKTMVWAINSTTGSVSYHAKYSIDYTTKPVSFEIRGFDQPEVKNYIFWGILEFDGSTRFRMDGAQHKIGQSASRPKKLGSDAVLFSKVK